MYAEKGVPPNEEVSVFYGLGGFLGCYEQLSFLGAGVKGVRVLGFCGVYLAAYPWVKEWGVALVWWLFSSLSVCSSR